MISRRDIIRRGQAQVNPLVEQSEQEQVHRSRRSMLADQMQMFEPSNSRLLAYGNRKSMGKQAHEEQAIDELTCDEYDDYLEIEDGEEEEEDELETQAEFNGVYDPRMQLGSNPYSQRQANSKQIMQTQSSRQAEFCGPAKKGENFWSRENSNVVINRRQILSSMGAAKQMSSSGQSSSSQNSSSNGTNSNSNGTRNSNESGNDQYRHFDPYAIYTEEDVWYSEDRLLEVSKSGVIGKLMDDRFRFLLSFIGFALSVVVILICSREPTERLVVCLPISTWRNRN